MIGCPQRCSWSSPILSGRHQTRLPQSCSTGQPEFYPQNHWLFRSSVFVSKIAEFFENPSIYSNTPFFFHQLDKHQWGFWGVRPDIQIHFLPLPLISWTGQYQSHFTLHHHYHLSSIINLTSTTFNCTCVNFDF